MTQRRADRRLTTAPAGVLGLVAAGALFAAGCYLPQGPAFSGNAPLTWKSTEHHPKTVSLLDTRTGETVWSVDIPVNKQLVVKFREGVGDSDHMPDVMEWRIMESGRVFGALDNTIPAPPRSARRVDMTLRPSPELSAEATTSASY